MTVTRLGNAAGLIQPNREVEIGSRANAGWLHEMR